LRPLQWPHSIVLRTFLLDPGSSLQRSCRSSGERGVALRISDSAARSRQRLCAPRLGQFPLERERSGAPRGASKHPRRLQGAARATRRRRARPTALRCGDFCPRVRASRGGRLSFPKFVPFQQSSLHSVIMPRGGVPKPPGSAGPLPVPAGAALTPSAERLRKTPLSERGERNIRPVGTMRIGLPRPSFMARRCRASTPGRGSLG
jgi:hypothetical protein